jgi:hypothetical protein
MQGGQVKTKAQPSAALSAGALDKRLELSRRGRSDGAANLPGGDAAEWSATEQSIVAAFAAERARIDEARAAARGEAERRLRVLAPKAQDFSAAANDARLEMRQIEGRVSHEWGEAAARTRGARTDLAAFKEAQGLRRSAVYPDSTLLQAGLLLCAAVFESLFSASLFAQTDERGLMGGMVIAVGLSGANVALGFLSGYIGLRYLQHARWAPRIAGAAAFAAFGGLALMLNLFAADWRDRIIAATGDAQALDADASFHLWSLLQLHSPQAIILLMLGVGVWVFAALKGYSGFDDPYPDFGKMDRAARAVADDLAEARAAALAELEIPIAAARSAIAAQLAKQRAEFDAMSKAYDGAALKQQGLDEADAKLDALADAALALYRDANRAARTAPAPAYFAQSPRWRASAPDALAGAGAMIEEARALIAAAQTASAAALNNLVEELEAAGKRLDAAAP